MSGAGPGRAPEPVVAPPPGEPRFPLLDAVRGMAAIAVVLAHAGGATGTVDKPVYGPLVANLDAGVTLFFVLSGFLLYRPLRGPRPPRLRDYARRRVLRIVPAYWVAITLLAVYPGLSQVHSGDWWRFYGFAQVYFPRSAGAGLITAWSLCVEVTFYAALPLLALAVARRRHEIAALCLLGVSSAALRAVDLYHQGDGPSGWTTRLSLLELFLWFAIGMVLAVMSGEGRVPRALDALARRPGWSWAGAIAAYVVMCAFLHKPADRFTYGPGQWMLQHVGSALVALLLVVPAIFRDREGGWPRRILAHPVVAWTGLVSYGTFLWHGGVLPVLQRHDVAKLGYPGFALVAVIVSVALGAASYYVIERPVLRLKDRRSAGSTAGALTVRATR
jgi:peptidoglycan/LPS O-acetylase OafA/YrhL